MKNHVQARAVARTRRHPLTRAQRMFWAARTLYPDRPVDNRVMKIEWRVELDVDAFKRALDALVERTDSLRLVFCENEDGLCQWAEEYVDPALTVRDFSDHDDAFESADAWLDELSARVLDIGTCVFETALARVGPDHWIWQLNQHHIATDFTSAELIVGRLSKLYDQSLSGSIPVAPPYPSYLEFLERHPQPSTRSEGKPSDPPPARLYPGVGRAVRSDNSRMLRYETHLGRERLGRARAYLGLNGGRGERRREALLFNLFAVSTFALVARTTGRRSVTIATPTHNRYIDGSGDVAGLFIRMLPLHLELQEDWSLEALQAAVRRVQRSVFSAAKSGSPMPERRYNVAVNYVAATMPDFHDTRSREITTTRTSDAVGLDLSLTIRSADTPGDIKLLFDVNSEVLQVVEARELARQFLKVFDTLLEHPGTRVNAIPLAGPDALAEAQSAAQRVFRSSPPRFASVPEALVSHARQTPEAEALRQGNHALTYAELELRSRVVAAGLIQGGAGPGKVVILQMPRSLELVVGMLGIMRSGASFCPLEPWSADERDKWIVEDTAAGHVLMKRGTVLGPAFELVEPVVLEDLVEDGMQSEAGEAPTGCDARAPAYIIYTSGTTGLPKGVEVRHESLARFLHWKHVELLHGKPVSFAFATSFAFDASLRFLVALYGGGTVKVYPDTRQLGDFPPGRVVAEDDVDAAMVTPSQLRLLVDRKWSLERLRSLAVLGEPLTRELASKACRALGPGVEILNCYGPTEAVLASTCHRFDPDKDSGETVSIGRPAPDVSVHVLDAGMNPVPVGAPGEIYIGGTRLASGYFNNPELTRKKFIPDPFCAGARLYRTGDIGWVDPNGDLVHHGRADDQFKINGVRFELAEVERAVREHPRVSACGAALVDGEPARLAVWYTAEEELPAGQLRAAAARHLPGPVVPSFYVHVNKLPLTPNGKVDRRSLPRFEPVRTRAPGVEAPRTETEKVLAAIWSRLLNVEDLGVDDDFFDLGGDSLGSVRMLQSIEEHFRLRLPVESIDRITTIENLASTLDEALAIRDREPADDGDPSVGSVAGEADSVDPEVVRRLRMFMAGWAGERVDDNALMFGLNMDGSLPPLLWCYNSNQEFVEMARRLGPDQPIYGVRSLKGVLKTKAEKLLQDRLIARRHVEELLRHCEEGPFFIGGNCQATRIALWMARHLIDLGKPVGLVCLMEKTPLMPYPGRVALIFGRDSERHNQFKKFAAPEIGWRRFYREVVWDIVPGKHGQFFHEANVGALCERISVRLAEARERVMAPLPPSAYAAGLELSGPVAGFAPREERVLRVRVCNEGTVTWRPSPESGIFLVNHWRRDNGTLIVRQDGVAELRERLAPGESCEVALKCAAPDVHGRVVLELELSEEGVALFSEQGVQPLRVSLAIKGRPAVKRADQAAVAARCEPSRHVEAVAAPHGQPETPRAEGLKAAGLGRHELATRLLRTAADDVFDVFLELGRSQLASGFPRAAIRSFQTALRIRPGDPDAARGVGAARWAFLKLLATGFRRRAGRLRRRARV